MIYIKKLNNQYYILGIILLIILGIGFLDYLTGYEISFSVFYLLPISLLALYRGTRKPTIIFTAIFSAIIWGTSELLTNNTYSHLLILFWNSFVRLVFFLIVGLLLLMVKNKHKNLLASNQELVNLNNEVNIKKNEIETINQLLSSEKNRSERLLTNLLPVKIIEKLKDYQGLIANHYDQCTVMFTDFKDFSILTEELSTIELVTELNYCFSAFDDIIDKYGIEKIKTIGDSYMCVGGIPVPKEKHSVDVILAALEISDFIRQYKEKRIAINKKFFEIRIGIHTGHLIAGIVGKHKFSYDVWGDTVNYASRLENASIPGMINISEATHILVKDYFDCTYRGKIAVKNKIETNMYFVERLKEEFSADKFGRTPNEVLYSYIKTL
jgi:class 3 adenylate cyclase